MLAAALLLLAAHAPADDRRWEALMARIEAAPADVSAFVERRAGCNHFDGEVGSEYAEREKMVQDARTKLRCDDLDADEASLRRAHRASAELLRLLDETKHLMPW
jgi:hypothetical protein